MSFTFLSLRKSESVQEALEDGDVDDVFSVDVDGVRVAYREYGEQNEETIVLVHGFLGSSYDFRFLSERLQADYHVVAMDMPGFGHSAKPLDYVYTRENQAETLSAFLEALDIETYMLFGHSMGGEVALRHAALHHERVEKLVLFASVGTEESNPRTFPLILYPLFFQNYYLQRRAFDTLFVDEAFQSAEYFDPMYYFTSRIPAGVFRKFSEDKDENPLAETIPDIDAPVLLIYGENDSWTPPETGETLNGLLAESSLIVLNDTGHLPFVESVDEVYEEVLAFLAD